MIFVKIGNVPWIYAVLAIVGYAAAVIVLTLALSRVEREIATTKSQRGFSQDTLEKTEEEYFLYFRLLYGAHLSFAFLLGGLILGNGDFNISAGIFVACVASGIALPFIILQRS